MNDPTCRTCAHYLQHYALGEGRIFRVNCGHCTFPFAKKKPPNSKKCDHYTPGCPGEASFVTKEYLSNALLEYMLRLELLPEIADNGP